MTLFHAPLFNWYEREVTPTLSEALPETPSAGSETVTPAGGLKSWTSGEVVSDGGVGFERVTVMELLPWLPLGSSAVTAMVLEPTTRLAVNEKLVPAGRLTALP